MSASRRRSSVTIAIAVVIAGLLVAGRLGRRPRGASPRVSSVTATAPDKPVMVPAAEPSLLQAPSPAAGPAPASAAATAPVSAAPNAQTAQTAQTAPNAPDAPTNVVAQQMRVTDAADRALLAEFERSGAKWPLSVAGELVALQKRGASRSDLESFIALRLHDNLPARVAATRWLRAKFETEPAATAPSAPNAAAQKPLGKGGGVRRVSTIQRTTAASKTGTKPQEVGKTGSPD